MIDRIAYVLKPFGLNCVALLPYSVALLCISAPKQSPFICHWQRETALPLRISHCLWQSVNRCGRWFQSQYQKAKQKGHRLMSFCFGKLEQYRCRLCRRHSRKKVVTTASRRECVYKRTGKPSVPFCEKGGTAF